MADELGGHDRRGKGDLGRSKTFVEERGGRETGAWRGDVERPGSRAARATRVHD